MIKCDFAWSEQGGTGFSIIQSKCSKKQSSKVKGHVWIDYQHCHVSGYSYLKKPSLYTSCWKYIKSQFVWPDILRWKGSVLLPTLPGIIVTTGFSCLVCLFHLTFQISIGIPVSVLGTVSVALGLLLAFRVNTAYDRYWEGRKLIQSVMGTIRNLARQVWINIPEENDNDHLEKMRCIKLLLAFFVATKRHLRHEYGTHYEDLEQLLPPKWEPASVAKTQQFKNSSGTSKSLHVKLGHDQNIKSKVIDKKNTPKSKKASLLVTFSNTIKPSEHGEYMPSDDPVDISNIRRSLIAQEFPGSTLVDTSQAYLRQAIPNHEPFSDDLIGQEEEEAQNTGEMDDLEASVPSQAVPGNRNLNPSTSTATTISGEERHVHHLFNRQHRKYFTRKQDHSKFTSEEDLPYQGDSDLSLPL
ncbi:UPF0187-domain-containing protein, partial [Backusella circina FSU 941]